MWPEKLQEMPRVKAVMTPFPYSIEQSAPLSEAQEMMASNQFPPGSMGPKVQASMNFVEATGKDVLITDEDSLKRALEGRAGTFLVAEGEAEYARIS